MSSQVVQARERMVVRFAGDSGDGIQTIGGRFSLNSAEANHDLVTFSDFPAEIRAPHGSLYGVSAYQVQFGCDPVLTIGDQVDVLVAFNPAALKTKMAGLKPGALIVVDIDGFNARNLKKAHYSQSPLEDGSLDGYDILPLEITRLTANAVAELKLSRSDAGRCKNFFALGLLYWMYGRERSATHRWIQRKFAKSATLAQGNRLALDAGHAFAETLELPARWQQPPVAQCQLAEKPCKHMTGAEATALGLAAAAESAKLKMLYASYPITPASALLHRLAKLADCGVRTLQAEDEIAACCAAIGASYAGALGVTGSSGPGIALKSEALALAVAAELPLVVVNVQRAGPSTGMPTKTEQSDLQQALYGRAGESPLVVLAASKPDDCFDAAFWAVKLAVEHMTPVMLLLDGFIANAAEPWVLPVEQDMPSITPQFAKPSEPFSAFTRNPDTLVRHWPVPGCLGTAHRLGGLERDADSGNLSSEPANHQRMTDLRAQKVANIAQRLPQQTTSLGPSKGKVLVITWGSCYGPAYAAVRETLKLGVACAHCHLRFIHPLPPGLEKLIQGFEQVLVVEINTGQLARHLRSLLSSDIEWHSLNKVTGQPFKVHEIRTQIHRLAEAEL